jgi:hypothetical protein
MVKMTEQTKIIKAFSENAKYYMVKFETKDNEEFGKILTDKEIKNIDLTKNEIYRSIEYKNGNTLFVYNLKPLNNIQQKIDNPIKLLINNLKEARAIETVYRGIFRWVYNGLNIKAYAIIPSGEQKSLSTLTRYGGTEMFIKILRQHLKNIGKMHKGLTPDYNFLNNKQDIEETELSLGSVNMFNGMYSIGADLNMDYINILKNSKINKQVWQPLNTLDMKYWTREINPDFIVEAKHIKLSETLSVEDGFKTYPVCIKNLTALKEKGNFNRFLLIRFLLSAHKSKDAKFIFDSVLTEKEKNHIKYGNCTTQFSYIKNNMKQYDCPTCSQLRRFCDIECNLVHPLEEIEKKLEKDRNE